MMKMTMADVDSVVALKRRAVEMANANNDEMDGTMERVKRIIADNDVVFAVWQDQTEGDGVGMLIVKGQALLRRCIAEGAIQARMSAIKCVCGEQAEALQRVCGERDARH
jgi:hypothetical protein